MTIRERAAAGRAPADHVGRMDGLHLEVLARALPAAASGGDRRRSAGTAASPAPRHGRGGPAPHLRARPGPGRAGARLLRARRAGRPARGCTSAGARSGCARSSRRGRSTWCSWTPTRPGYPGYLAWARAAPPRRRRPARRQHLRLRRTSTSSSPPARTPPPWRRCGGSASGWRRADASAPPCCPTAEGLLARREGALRPAAGRPRVTEPGRQASGASQELVRREEQHLRDGAGARRAA